MIIMPNHFHCIIINVGADQRVCPEKQSVFTESVITKHNIKITGEQNGKITNKNDNKTLGKHDNCGEHIGSPLHRVVQWFKTMTTNEYIRCVKQFGWHPFNGKLWQRNYYDHTIRNERALNHIRHYIVNNPLKWENNRYHKPEMNK